MTLSLDDVKKMKVQVLLIVTLIVPSPHMSLQSCVTDLTPSTTAQGRDPNHQPLDRAVERLS